MRLGQATLRMSQVDPTTVSVADTTPDSPNALGEYKSDLGEFIRLTKTWIGLEPDVPHGRR